MSKNDKKDVIGSRMKEFYENIPKNKLMRRCPVAIRIDGRAFHTFTHNLKKPFDDILVKSMQDTMKYLCENIQGCVLGYTQSDEITLILIDYQTLTSSAWFDYEVEKMCSISASMATKIFNKAFNARATKYLDDLNESWNISDEDRKYEKTLCKCMKVGAEFDSRCFNIPKEEVTNLVFWRQNDASKNSVQMVGRAYFSHTELKDKNLSDIQDMLHEKHGVNWNNYPTELKRGSACIRTDSGWIIDHEMPILKGDDRQYVDSLIYVGE
jgi:tRNA(His) 5'-end guanylyltransferase